MNILTMVLRIEELDQAGTELCQAQVKLEVGVGVGVEFWVEVEACHS